MKLATVVEGDHKAPFSIATASREAATPFSGLLHLIMESSFQKIQKEYFSQWTRRPYALFYT